MQVDGVALTECENSIKDGILGAPIGNDGQRRGVLQNPEKNPERRVRGQRM